MVGGATMKRDLGILLSAIVVIAVLGTKIAAGAKTMEQPLVRIAELEIDAGQVEAYTNALKEEVETSIRVEPGVLTLYAVSVKAQPNQIRIFETYKDEAAYESHLQTPHFRKYKAETQGMVKSLKLIETEPIVLGRK
jgi:quinol monooxygenase YgiN